jgi:hypothetical protein
VRTRSSANGYFNRTFGTPTNASRWTKSLWIKRGALGYVPILGAQTISAAANYAAQFNSNDTFTWQFSNALTLVTTQVFRDPSAWYHIVLVWDCTNATAANRAIIYVNGVQVTAFTTDNRASLSATQNAWETAGTGFISYNNTTNTFDGYLAEINFVDGQALTPSSFGGYNAITGAWGPIAYAGTYGANGFKLNFQDNSGATATTIGKDSSGNNNNWTPNNISVTAGVTYDSMLDVPTVNSPTNANFAVFNPLAVTSVASTFAEGNLKVTTGAAGGNGYGTFAIPSSRKWYWEITAGSANSLMIGISAYLSTQTYAWQNTNSVFYYNNGQKYVDGTGSAYGATYTNGDVIGVAVDVDASTITFYKNNVSQGAISHTFIDVFPCLTDGASVTSDIFFANFGQQPFVYTPPTGHLRLNTFNLSALIPNGAAQFAATLYTGNGGTQVITNTVNGVSMQPDLVWIKGRSGATNHGLQDSVRGTAGGILVSNSTAVESAGGAYISSLNSNGFTVNANTSGNGSAATYVGWQWKASNAAAVTNTAGSISSQVSANLAAGFSIVTYTGTGANATVGHGLGIAPQMVIVKSRNVANNWTVWHTNITGSQFLLLNATNAASTATNVWNSTTPTSTVFSVGTNVGTNFNATTYVTYCFAAVPGYSAFGNYAANNNTNGPFVHTGFRPRFVIIKEYTSARGWIMFDTSRSPYNVVDNYLFTETAAAAGTLNLIDVLSNGFKIRSTNLNVNDASGQFFLYMAFAENPFKYALAR